MTRTEELLALASNATPGPWKLGNRANMALDPDTLEIMAGNFYVTDAISRDAAFIAAANPETIKQLVEQMNRLVAGLSDVRNARDDMEMWGIANDTLEAFNKWEGR